MHSTKATIVVAASPAIMLALAGCSTSAPDGYESYVDWASAAEVCQPEPTEGPATASHGLSVSDYVTDDIDEISVTPRCCGA